MSKVTYCRITFDDGSVSDLNLSEFQKLHDACVKYAKDGQERVYLGQEPMGTQTFFFISKVQDVIVSTPESRATLDTMNAELKKEADANKRIWE